MPDKEDYCSGPESPRPGLGRSLAHRVVVPVLEAPLHSVVVHRDRAEVKRCVSVKLRAGENEVALSRLTECVDKNSIRWAIREKEGE